MSLKMTNLALMTVMITTSLLAMAFHPTHRIADDEPALNLETMIPTQFGDWQEMPQQSIQIINPQQKEVLDRIYTQTLSRTYVNSKGDSVMLSIAYGVDQSGDKQLHYPELCYPAQGFQIKSTSFSTLKTTYGGIPVKKLVTVMGPRSEPLTYWTTIGNNVVLGGKQFKLMQVRYGFKGLIPDGLIFRVSTISEDDSAAFQLQEDFVSALVHELPSEILTRVTGLNWRDSN